MGQIGNANSDPMRNTASRFRDEGEYIRALRVSFHGQVDAALAAIGGHSSGRDFARQFAAMMSAQSRTLHVLALASEAASAKLRSQATLVERVEDRNARLSHGLAPAMSADAEPLSPSANGGNSGTAGGPGKPRRP